MVEKVARIQLAAQPGCEAARRLAQLEAQIPSHVLQTFLAARGRNHQVNREAVALLAEGIVKQVCFLQEDSAPQGMHRAEQQQLQALAEAQGVSEQVSIHCGTDECACALVGCLAAQRQAGGPALRLYVEWLAGDMQFTARYEDRPFAENLDAYLKTCRIMRVQSPKDAQAVLAVYAPSGPQMDLAMAPEDAVCAYTPGQLGNIAERLQALMDTGLPTGLLDVYHANGGESSLLRLASTKRPSGAPCRICRMEYSMQFTWHHSGAASCRRHRGFTRRSCSFYSRAPAGRLGLSGYCAPPVEQGTSGRGHRYLGPAGRAGRQRPPATADGTYP